MRAVESGGVSRSVEACTIRARPEKSEDEKHDRADKGYEADEEPGATSIGVVQPTPRERERWNGHGEDVDEKDDTDGTRSYGTEARRKR